MMTNPVEIQIQKLNLDALGEVKGCLAVFVGEDGKLSRVLRRVNRLTKGAVARVVASSDFDSAKTGKSWEIAFPAGLDLQSLILTKVPMRFDLETARKIGASLGAKIEEKAMTVVPFRQNWAEELALGLALRAYHFTNYQTVIEPKQLGSVTFFVDDPDVLHTQLPKILARVKGVFFTRDLVNEPANILTTDAFSYRLEALSKLGLQVETLDEKQLESLGMRLLLSVGQGSESPSKVVVLRWQGGGDEKPFAFVGKGVVFDSGGISIKPAAGMEEMTMDMGGAGVVAGVMKTLALRKARANVVGVIGLVENMPSGSATRPGDIVESLKGDTVEVINTDAEGRLVLADCLWYTQQRFQPSGIINLATLTGAIIIALGNDNAGVFSNDEALAAQFLKVAKSEGEGAWRMPLGSSYDMQLKSRLADMKNVGTRAGGAITAAQFLQRFIKEEQPWAHIDIAGVALSKKTTGLAPSGATGWGVLALDRLIASFYEKDG